MHNCLKTLENKDATQLILKEIEKNDG